MNTASPAAYGPLLDTVLLRTFLEIVDSGSFAAAAERLALTPSAVSGHMRRLPNSPVTMRRSGRPVTMAETPGHDAETGGHVGPKYANAWRDRGATELWEAQRPEFRDRRRMDNSVSDMGHALQTHPWGRQVSRNQQALRVAWFRELECVTRVRRGFEITPSKSMFGRSWLLAPPSFRGHPQCLIKAAPMDPRHRHDIHRSAHPIGPISIYACQCRVQSLVQAFRVIILIERISGRSYSCWPSRQPLLST